MAGPRLIAVTAGADGAGVRTVIENMVAYFEQLRLPTRTIDARDGTFRFAAGERLVFVRCEQGLSWRTLDWTVRSDALLLVSSGTPEALADTFATLKYLAHVCFSARVGLVLNQSRSRRDGLEALRRFQAAASRFLGLGVRPLGVIVWDYKVIRAAQRGEPVLVRYPFSDVARDLKAVARRLAGFLAPEPDPRPKPQAAHQPPPA